MATKTPNQKQQGKKAVRTLKEKRADKRAKADGKRGTTA